MRGNPVISAKSNLTFSIDNGIYDSIKDMAKKQNQSVNSVINQIFSKHLQFYKFIEEQQDVMIPPSMYVSVIDLVGEKNFFEILIKHNNEIIPSVFVNHNIPYTLENLIEYFLKGPMIWGGAYSSMKYVVNGNESKLIFEHRKNQVWSKLLGDGLCDLIKNSFGYECNHNPEKHYSTINVIK